MTMDWREKYESKDSNGNPILDVWMRDGVPLAYLYEFADMQLVRGNSLDGILVKKALPKTYSFLEAVERMEQGKVMRPVGYSNYFRRGRLDPRDMVEGEDGAFHIEWNLAWFKAPWEEVPS